MIGLTRISALCVYVCACGWMAVCVQNYFNTCAPTSCTYTRTQPLSAAEFVSMLLAVVGGLKAVIEVCV
jgi:hypothetical protein